MHCLLRLGALAVTASSGAFALGAVVGNEPRAASRPGQRVTTPAAFEHAVRDRIYALVNLLYRFYYWIAGTHPYRRAWHSQWLSVKDLYADLRRILPKLDGQVLDVGCFGKPYAPWLKRADAHVGIDLMPGAMVDFVVRDGEPWPLKSESFNSALCTQVLQVTGHQAHLVDELARVLIPGGIAVITTPSSSNDVSAEYDGTLQKDYWRHTLYGLEALFAEQFEILELRRQGGIGSNTGSMMLNWIHAVVSRRLTTQLLLLLLLPLWLAFCLVVNLIGHVLDKLDRTGRFYHNVLIVVRKKALPIVK